MKQQRALAIRDNNKEQLPTGGLRLPAWAKPVEYRTAFMQRLQDRVIAGYIYWTSGIIGIDRWPALANKLNGLYTLDRTIKQRSAAKKNGNGSAMLIAFLNTDLNSVYWVMQVSPGNHPAHTLEGLKDVTGQNGRIAISNWGYELIRFDNKWTWRMTKQHQIEWRKRIRQASAHRNPTEAARYARQIVWSLSHVPGFRGIRVSAFRLRGLLLKEWRRLRNSEDMSLLPPRPWPRIGYCRRVKSS